MEEIVTQLEMTAADQLNPAPLVDGVALRTIRPGPLIRELHLRIGTPYRWPSASRGDEEWDRWLAAPHREYRLIEYQGEVAGAADFEAQPGNDVEITTFGLVPEFVGKGLGGCALTLVVADAWALPGTRRVWLHTSTLDHPNALPNYLRRGFRSFSHPL
ncbi:acetyltransferase [Amycolatopsis mediterranei S699]|uniref:Acetyltransferase n=2 Tax=Amycolatopsis mediterranei TaxID=33910 RepID=A0A0H3CZJ5_AMYMU|nr:GNAT family N-acetyltransferase [Amycolatopsis mediterranei]ADJ44072.1 acetyltransferase [Amycolatopsis mediterranei U32]AEK40807.1 acetyltransferase [Amycolatopsis mediterranei S699]AFO75786.1 acetyltransferase [Amycolatopsis mediterranei S699]AGT82915.1 acetyltransferase [Amycolatopsis mediterranei RB]KDO06496.1 acetyltransferase [Amycolatopsis mediterranei]